MSARENLPPRLHQHIPAADVALVAPVEVPIEPTARVALPVSSHADCVPLEQRLFGWLHEAAADAAASVARQDERRE